MRVVYGFEALGSPLDRSVLTIGNFDGVHLGHRHILALAGRLARPAGIPVAALTFEPHPLTVVAPQRAPQRLITADEKVTQLGAAGADVVVVARSEPALLSLEAETFAREYVARLFRPSQIVVGADFGFGKGRRGNVETLRTLASERGFEVVVAEAFYLALGGERLVVSSSLIRSLLAEGRAGDAARCLGRPYTLAGVVVHGDGRGRELGFPTANVEVDAVLIPGEGVYAGRARVEAGEFPAAISIGRNATFGGQTMRVEAYLLGFEGQLYGQRVRLEVQRRLREQRKFDSVSELVEQIRRDVEETAKVS